MTNTAPVIAPVVSREIAPGVQVNSGMSSREIFQAHLKANVQPSQLGIGHTDGTAMRLAQGDGKVAELLTGKAPPPSAVSKAPPDAKELEASRRAELQEIVNKVSTLPQRDASGRFASAPVEVDATGIDALNKAFAKLTRSERDTKRGQYEEELAEFYNGRRFGESRDAYLARANGQAPAATPANPGESGGHSIQAWEKAHASVANAQGLIPVDRLNKAGLSGYSLLKLTSDWGYPVSIFQQLAAARAAGVSQKQVDDFIRAQAAREGWIK